ncbi:guanine nucleotide-binding protein-like 3-like protein [Turdus rufiventris]|nr:guanine nucleotide-binding protein-like 3-like protein [Turdus rufiventris]
MTRSRRQVEASRKKRVQARRARVGIKKDPGVPQLGRFAAFVQQQSKTRQKRALEVQQSSHLEVQQSSHLAGHLADALRRQQHFQSQVGLGTPGGLPKEYPQEKEEEEEPPQPPQDEASLRQFGRELRKVLTASDVVLEVLDARDPQGCRSPRLEGALRPHQRLVLVLNKIDLVPRDVVAAWLKHLRAEFPTVAFKACTQQQSRNLKQSRVPAATAPEEVLAGGACVGAESLLHILSNYGRCGGAKTSITVGVVGTPQNSPGLPTAVPVTVTGLGLSPGNPEKEEEGEAMEDDSGDVEVGRDLLRYLEITPIPLTDPPEFKYQWGPRAQKETSKMDVLKFVAKIQGKDPTFWASQYAEAQAEATH